VYREAEGASSVVVGLDPSMRHGVSSLNTVAASVASRLDIL
jgi:hypothetical protein